MPESITDPTAQTGHATGSPSGSAAGEGQITGAGTGAVTGGDAGQTADERRFSQADIDRIVKARLEDEKLRAKRTADEAAAKARGEFEQLAEQRAQRVAELEAELQTARLSGLRATVAAKHNLPAELASRLTGSTEAELDADAQALAALVTNSRVRSADANAGNSRPPAGPSMNDFIRRAAGRA